MTITIHSPLALQPEVQPGQLSCPFSRRMARLIDGTRTLQEVASLLKLPVQVTLKLALKGVNQGWLTSAEVKARPNSATYKALCDELGLVFGSEAKPMVERALHMTRLNPAEVSPRNVADVLLALEFQLHDDTREAMCSTLHTLQLAYSA